MELSQLRTILQVAELGSLSKASDRLHVAQPALSRQVRMLEEELGFLLFARHGRGMVVTDQGRDVLRHAARVLAELDEIRATVTNADTPLTGQIAIGLPPTVADIISVPLVAAIVKAHPQVRLRLVGAYTGYLLDWLHRGEIDLAILYDPRATRSLRCCPLLLERLFLIGPPDAGLSAVAAVPFETLQGKPMLLPSTRHGLRTIVERCAADSAVTFDAVVEADSYGTLKDLVHHGHGWTILPLAPIREDIDSGKLTAAPLIDPVPVRRLVLGYPADRSTSRLARFVGEAIRKIIEDQVERGAWVAELLTADA